MTMEVVVSCHLSPSASSKNEWKQEAAAADFRHILSTVITLKLECRFIILLLFIMHCSS